ncbi:hypothetical protein SAMN06265222_11873 [Neorhodopirellula lusitana]|uniref:DUF983 domain-containing protein n=1 Tax=Neorhodopirellula lusitana TaxID=445327 RepID=A0ABY1QNS6_9BACT|nr:hypothetical protein [Neorhodopirellula lusitana]SMP74907.1 hypothetical protein SAMN06265222_11873 [Neorhodopirellula lusitana]
MTDQPNPYQTPETTDSVVGEPLPEDAGRYAPCPSCGQVAAKQVGMTWWGGVLGPKLLKHVRCTCCGRAYNGKTGGSNRWGIAIYLGVSFLLGAIAFGILLL